MRLTIMNPAFPGDKTKARDLTKEQFQLVHDDVVAFMNTAMSPRCYGRATRQAELEARIIKKCADAGLPINFN